MDEAIKQVKRDFGRTKGHACSSSAVPSVELTTRSAVCEQNSELDHDAFFPLLTGGC